MTDIVNRLSTSHNKAELVQITLQSIAITTRAVDYLRMLTIDPKSLTTWEEAFYNSPAQVDLRSQKREEIKEFIRLWDESHGHLEDES